MNNGNRLYYYMGSRSKHIELNIEIEFVKHKLSFNSYCSSDNDTIMYINSIVEITMQESKTEITKEKADYEINRIVSRMEGTWSYDDEVEELNKMPLLPKDKYYFLENGKRCYGDK